MRPRPTAAAAALLLLLVGPCPLAPSPALALELVAPRPDGVALAGTLRVEVGRARSAPSGCRLDGVALAPAWVRLPYSGRWVADVAVPAGRHVLEVSSAGSRARASFEAVTSAVAPGDLVARHFLAASPPDDLAWQWGPAVFLYGLARYAQVSPDRAAHVQALERFYARHAARGLPRIDHPDVCAPALGALALWRDLGSTAGLGGATAIAAYLRREPRNALGAIDHLGANGRLRSWASLAPFVRHWSHSVWVDSLVMYAVFAAQWGTHTSDAALRDFGAEQPLIFARVLQDPATGLFVHAWDVAHARRMGARWLRGNGWAAASLVEVLDALPPGHRLEADLERVLRDLAAGLLARQLPNGLWDSLADAPGASYPEASGSALVAFALAKGARLGVLPAAARARARLAFEALTARLARRRDGLAVTGTSVATNPYPELLYTLVPRRDDVPYGAGAYLLLAAELSAERWR